MTISTLSLFPELEAAAPSAAPASRRAAPRKRRAPAANGWQVTLEPLLARRVPEPEAAFVTSDVGSGAIDLPQEPVAIVPVLEPIAEDPA